MNDSFTKPILIEPGVKSFLNETLRQCRVFKNAYHNLLFNISIGVTFLVILAIILFFKYKGKLTPAEKEMRNRQKQQYILSKIQNFQEAKQRAHQELITGLPHWETEYDVVNRKILGGGTR